MLMILPLSVSLCWPVKGVKRLVSYHNVCAGSNSRNQPAERVDRLCGSRPPLLCLSLALFLSFTNTCNAISCCFDSFLPFPFFDSALPVVSFFSHFRCLRVSIIFIFCVWLFLFQAHVSSLHPQVVSTTSSMGSTPSGSLFSSFLHHTHPPPPPHRPPPPLSLHSPASTPCL